MSTDRLERFRVWIAGGPFVTPTLHRINFLILVLLLLLNGGNSYNANRRLIRNELRIQNTQAVLAAIKDAFSALQDAETGQRGFVITADPQYLAPYNRAVEELEVRLTTLGSLDSELEVQRESLALFAKLIDQKLSELEEVVELVESSREDAAVLLVETDRGNELMARIRSLVELMESRGYLLMGEQREAASKSREQVLRSIHVATLAGLIFLTIAFYLVQRTFRMERENVAKLILTNEELEAIVAERTIALDRYAMELTRSNRELQDFAFVASHDLQEPLRKIRAFGDRLKVKYSDPLGDGADYVTRMQAAAERMSQLINDLLTFSRVTTQAKVFQRTSLQAILEDVLDDLGQAIEEREATITVDPLPEIEANPTQMRQLLQNLIGNALKFVQPGVVPVVRISTFPIVRDDDLLHRVWHRITIEDNGIGFDETFAEKIFTPFQRLHPREEYSGTGIGLAVCRRVVEQHDGSITVTSRPGVGSSFEIQLPQTQPPQTVHSDPPVSSGGTDEKK